MLGLDEVVKLLQTGTFPSTPFLAEWRDVYYRMSLHTTGVCPGFRNMRFDCAPDIAPNGDKVYPFVKPYGWGGVNYDYYFDTFLLNRHPREDERIRQWRKSQYRPFQKAAFQQVIDKAAGTIFSESNYSLTVENKEDNDYIQGNNFNGRSLIGYIHHHFKAICEDPNGVFVVIPSKRWDEVDTNKVEPQIYFINSKNIVFVSPDEIIFNLFDYSWLVNNIGYFRFQKDEATGQFINVDGNSGYYGHLMGRIPKHFAGGVWNTLGWYDSYLDAGRAFADEFVSTYSATQLVNKDNSYPYITMAQDKCPQCNGVGKMQYCRNCKAVYNECMCGNTELTTSACRDCGGEGQISWNPGNVKVAPAKDMDKDLIKVLTPSVEINKHLSEESQYIYEGILKALHQQFVDEAQSGKAKEIDREGQYLFLQNISNGLFDLAEKLLVDILGLRNTSFVNGKPDANPGTYTIIKPTQFSLKTENDLLEEFKTATEANMPAFIRARQIREYVDKLYGGDAVMKKKTEIILLFDSMAVDTVGDKISKKNSGAVSQSDFQYSAELPRMVDKLVQDRGGEWLLSQTYENIKAAIDEIFKAIPVITTATPTTLQDKVSAAA